MRSRVSALLLTAAIAVPAWAQQGSSPITQRWPDLPPAQEMPKGKQRSQPRDDVEELTPGQIRRAQERDPGPAKERPQAVKRPTKASRTRQVTCSGPFARDSSHIRLAQVFGSRNVSFVEVDGPANSKLMASVLFPNDPKQRLEVLWTNDATRSGTQVIAINGKSAWSAPHGLKLGLQIAAIEKMNKKPFKLTGFGADGSTVADWNGGALSKSPGECKMGVRLIADQHAPEDARKRVAEAKELESSDAGVRALRATVAEILIGY